MNAITSTIIKEAYIRQLSDGRYRVYSEKGKNLGTSKQKGKAGKSWAEKRLQQVEMFKHMKKDKKSSIEAEMYFKQALEEFIQVKSAASVIPMGDSKQAGKTLASIVKFLTQRISPERRPISLSNLRQKIWDSNEYGISSKESPASASLGQAITFIKTVLNGHAPDYIREVLRNIVANM